MEKLYHVYSFLNGCNYPIIAQCYKTKKAAEDQYKKRVSSGQWDYIRFFAEYLQNGKTKNMVLIAENKKSGSVFVRG